MIKIEDIKVAYIDAFMVSMSNDEGAQAIFFNHNYAKTYADALAAKYIQNVIDASDLAID